MGAANHRVDVGWSALAMGLHDDETGETFSLSVLHRLQAAIAKAGGNSVSAERYLRTALDVAQQQGAKLWELRAAIDLARLWQEQDRNDEAIAILTPVHKSIAHGDCPEDQATARALLADLTG